MQSLQGHLIYLRALEPTDLDFLYDLENDENVWEVSNTTTPFSKFILKQYLKNSHRDIYEIKQLRLVICQQVVCSHLQGGTMPRAQIMYCLPICILRFAQVAIFCIK